MNEKKTLGGNKWLYKNKYISKKSSTKNHFSQEIELKLTFKKSEFETNVELVLYSDTRQSNQTSYSKYNKIVNIFKKKLLKSQVKQRNM